MLRLCEQSAYEFEIAHTETAAATKLDDGFGCQHYNREALLHTHEYYPITQQNSRNTNKLNSSSLVWIMNTAAVRRVNMRAMCQPNGAHAIKCMNASCVVLHVCTCIFHHNTLHNSFNVNFENILFVQTGQRETQVIVRCSRENRTTSQQPMGE